MLTGLSRLKSTLNFQLLSGISENRNVPRVAHYCLRADQLVFVKFGAELDRGPNEKLSGCTAVATSNHETEEEQIPRNRKGCWWSSGRQQAVTQQTTTFAQDSAKLRRRNSGTAQSLHTCKKNSQSGLLQLCAKCRHSRYDPYTCPCS